MNNAATATAAQSATPSAFESATLFAPTDAEHSDVRMRDRIAGQDDIEEVLSHQSETRARGRLSRIFGISPISAIGMPWYNSALGEVEVGEELAKLPEGWFYFHALPIGLKSPDIDHVVVGPGGVFVITSRRHRGRKITVDRSDVLVNREVSQHVSRAVADSLRLEKMLAFNGFTGFAVRPVIAVVEAREITYKEHPTRFDLRDGHSLASWLRKRPELLSPAKVAEIVAKLDEPVRWRKGIVPEATLLNDFEQLRAEVERAANVQRIWVLSGLAAAVGVVALSIPTLAGILAPIFG
ncbi:NERD domain-containing protein [Naasia lichenicola]|uniref:NERD domain-containing protein n=1 Tax=Naasia lichenicola TaxID=2565933 RepID=A0A4S4FSR0_9MICO|nr:NERD domain-containing protein [Naasia lichenicola]THG33341.1 hypothetical protein E6C64_03025 [Naasia lichenicola]